MEIGGQENLDMFMSLHGSLYIPFGGYRNDNTFFVLANGMMQGAYNRFDFGAKYEMDRFSFGLFGGNKPYQNRSK